MQPSQGPPQSPKKSNEQTKVAWDTQAGDWVYKDDKRDAIPAPLFEEFYQKHRAQFKDALDIGCGTGKFLIPMAQDGLQVTGVEFSSKRKEATEANLERAGLKGKTRIMEGDSKDLVAIKSESIDWIFSKGAIHHNTWAGIQKSFQEATRVLRPGGFFLFQGRSTKDAALGRSELILDTRGSTARGVKFGQPGVIEHYFTEQELRDLASENGLKIVLGPQEINHSKLEDPKMRWWVVYRKI